MVQMSIGLQHLQRRRNNRRIVNNSRRDRSRSRSQSHDACRGVWEWRKGNALRADSAQSRTAKRVMSQTFRRAQRRSFGYRCSVFSYERRRERHARHRLVDFGHEDWEIALLASSERGDDAHDLGEVVSRTELEGLSGDAGNHVRQGASNVCGRACQSAVSYIRICSSTVPNNFSTYSRKSVSVPVLMPM